MGTRLGQTVQLLSCISRLSEQVLAAIEKHPGDSSIASNGLGAIGNMLAHKDATKQFVTELAGINATIRVMKKFPDAAHVQKKGVFVLNKISIDKAFRDGIISAGGIQALGEAMQRFQNDEEIQLDAREALADVVGAKLDDAED